MSAAAAVLPPHPDRLAPTLAVRAQLLRTAGDGPYATPGPGSADARVDLKLGAWAAREALEQRGTDIARERLSGLCTPDLVAGTVQDGTARGLAVAYEEAISLCQADPVAADLDEPTETSAAKQLRRKREFVIASGGARVRFSRKRGVLFVDRANDVHAEDCVRFEDRSDLGDLDGFVAADGQRPRLFSPAFLTPVRLDEASSVTRLVLEGRLGRRPDGYACRLEIEGRAAESFVRLTVSVRNDHDDHRLRIRFLGCRRPAAIGHEGTPAWEVVETGGRRFLAATLVRACGRLALGDRWVAVPGAQCKGWIEHRFRLGLAPWSPADADHSRTAVRESTPDRASSR